MDRRVMVAAQAAQATADDVIPAPKAYVDPARPGKKRPTDVLPMKVGQWVGVMIVDEIPEYLNAAMEPFRRELIEGAFSNATIENWKPPTPAPGIVEFNPTTAPKLPPLVKNLEGAVPRPDLQAEVEMLLPEADGVKVLQDNYARLMVCDAWLEGLRFEYAMPLGAIGGNFAERAAAHLRAEMEEACVLPEPEPVPEPVKVEGFEQIGEIADRTIPLSRFTTEQIQEWLDKIGRDVTMVYGIDKASEEG